MIPSVRRPFFPNPYKGKKKRKKTGGWAGRGGNDLKEGGASTKGEKKEKEKKAGLSLDDAGDRHLGTDEGVDFQKTPGGQGYRRKTQISTCLTKTKLEKKKIQD